MVVVLVVKMKRKSNILVVKMKRKGIMGKTDCFVEKGKER